MALGRLVHYAVDVVLVSAVLAGVKKSTGYTPQTNLITEPTLRSVADSVLGLGETVFGSSVRVKRNALEGGLGVEPRVAI
ncbi:hypothetical protein OPQ81_001630 [Rhizoctonia solani]|nr:hypothetical protein OPQ81_001630 [Rhizoctonia solani]